MEIIDINVLNNQKRTNQKISNELRTLIIQKMNEGMTPKQITDGYNVKSKTASHIYQTYRKTGLVNKRKRGHRKRILSDNQKE